MKRRTYPASPSFIFAVALLSLAFLLAGIGYVLLWKVRPGEIVEVATIGGWGFDAANHGIVVSHNNRNLFTLQPWGLAPVLGLIAGALFLRNHFNHRDTRKRGFSVGEPK